MYTCEACLNAYLKDKQPTLMGDYTVVTELGAGGDRLNAAHKQRNEEWCVYVLNCRNGSLYTCITNDLAQRLKQHEKGKGNKYVRSWWPFVLVRTISCKDAGEARRLEHNLKRLTRQEKIAALGLGNEM